MEITRRRIGVVAAGAILTLAAACTPAPGPQGSGPWTWTEIRVGAPERTQGLATDPDGPVPGDTWYSSQFTIERAAPDGTPLGLTWALPLDVLLQWKSSHTGDID